MSKKIEYKNKIVQNINAIISRSELSGGVDCNISPDIRDLYRDTINAILSSNAEVKKKCTIAQVGNLLFSLVSESVQRKTKIDYQDLDREVIQKLVLLRRYAFHNIFGLIVSTPEPVSAGDFRFYNLKTHKKYLNDIGYYSTPDDDEDGSENKCDTLVSVEVQDRDYACPIKEARKKLESLQNIFRFSLSVVIPAEEEVFYDIGIFNYKKSDMDMINVVSERGESIFCASGNGDEETMAYSGLERRLLGEGIALKKLIERCFEKSDLRKQFAAAIDYYGQAVYNIGKPACFLESAMAIEALVPSDSGNSDITSKLAEFCALLLGNTYEERVKIEKEMKELYKVRSKIAHGRINDIERKHCPTILDVSIKPEDSMVYLNNVIMDYAKKLLLIFIKDINVKDLHKSEDLKEYIKRLKYGNTKELKNST